MGAWTRRREQGGEEPRLKGACVVAHLTTVHPPRDVRIFVKECRSLAAAGHVVHLIAPGAPDSLEDGVRLHGLASGSSGRVARMTAGVGRAFRMARALDADVYHLHDPELIPAGLLLAAGGKQVVYDAHENLPEQVLTKGWIPAPLRRALGLLVDRIERLAARAFAGVIAAAPYIERRFASSGARTATLRNYPLVAELAPPGTGWSTREHAVCYAGSITEIRGAREMVSAIGRTGATLLLAGTFAPPGLEGELAGEPGWSQVVPLGQLGARELAEVMGRSRAGLVVLRAVPRYMDTTPTKLFDYMSAGIPVIASDFPAWRAIVDRHECGVCVDPADPEAIAESIDWLLAHPDDAERMGVNGRRAVERHYSWESERSKMLQLYSELGCPGERHG